MNQDFSGKPSPNTDTTASMLLIAASKSDPQAWVELLDRYSRLVLHWCRNSGLSAEDAADVLQIVMTQVAIYLPGFKKDGEKAAFRRWLRTITRTKLAQFQRDDHRQLRGQGGTGALHRLLKVADRKQSDDTVTLGYHPLHEMLWSLLDELEDEVEVTTWKAFWLTAVENRTSTEAGAALGMSPTAVRLAKARVLQRLRARSNATSQQWLSASRLAPESDVTARNQTDIDRASPSPGRDA